MREARQFETRVLADNVTRKYPEIRESAGYKKIQSRIIELTMSCNKEEQRNWMLHYMSLAIQKDDKAVRMYASDKNWKSINQMRYEAALLFIAAYDLL